MIGVAGQTRCRIGVTGPDRGGYAAWTATRFAVWLAGGVAVRMTPRRTNRIADVHAVIIGGGADVGLLPDEVLVETAAVDPPCWRTRLLDGTAAPFVWLLRAALGKHQREAERVARDEFEFACFAHAREHAMPVLGICRGAQLINVALGGRLFRDLAGFYEESPAVRSILPRKSVAIAADSRLRAIIGAGRCRVNALHRQAIDADRLGAGLRVAARESTGVVQAIESVEAPLFLIGVQWHPEYLPQHAAHRRLFAALVEAARSR